MVMKALLGKSNNGIGKAIQNGELKLPSPFEEFKPKRRTQAWRLSGKDGRIEAFLSRVMWRLILKLITSPKAIIIDSTELKADPRKDRGGAWGHNSKGKFYGYKLHLVSTENSIPIGFRVTIGSVHDVKMFIPLLKDSLSILRRVKTIEYLIGDATYDSLKAIKEAIGINLIPVVKLNKRRGKPRGIRTKVSKFLEIEEGQRIFSLRSAIERANSFLKEGMGINKFPSYVRGVKRVELFIQEKMLATFAVMLTNLKTKKPILSYA